MSQPHPHRVLTGDRPTGPLHLGHYFGTLQNRVRLQDDGADLLVLVADLQTIIDRDSPAPLPEDVDGLLADHLAVGIDPDRASIFAHSQVEALNGLLVPFLSLVSVAELSRNPTVKDELAAAGLASMPGLMFTYPVHQAADILFCKATLVPVGRDQLPHLEVARLIARRFNRRYSPERPLFPEPAPLLGDAPALLGTDGQKMSKSRGNAIAIGATADETARLIAGAKTDPERAHRLRPVATARGVQPRPARRAVPGARARGGRGGDRGPRQPGAQGPGHRGRQRAVPRHPRPPRRADRRSGVPAPGPPGRDGAGAGDRRTRRCGRSVRACTRTTPSPRLRGGPCRLGLVALLTPPGQRDRHREADRDHRERQPVGTCQTSVMSIFTPTHTRIAASP